MANWTTSQVGQRVGRQFSVYEKNQLLKYGIGFDDLARYGEMPVEYITGWAPFLDDDFDVSPDVLIPRVETADLVEIAEELLVGKGYVRVADIGTGSGCVAITLHKRLTKSGVMVESYLSDISGQALEIARKNAKRILSQGARVKFLRSDLFSEYPKIKFDLIVANLPYIPTTRLKTLDKSVTEFEPVIALDGGLDGLVLIKRFLAEARKYLVTGGKLLLEIDETHDLSDFQEFDHFVFGLRTDQFGKNRFLIVS